MQIAKMGALEICEREEVRRLNRLIRVLQAEVKADLEQVYKLALEIDNTEMLDLLDRIIDRYRITSSKFYF